MYQGDRPGLTDKVNLVAQRQRRSVSQLATDVVARSSYAAKGDVVTGYGANEPGRVPVGDEGMVLTADPNSPGGVRWARAADPALSSGIGAFANCRNSVGTLGHTYAVGAAGELMVNYLPDSPFNLSFTNDDGDWEPWFTKVTGGPAVGGIQVNQDSIVMTKVSAQIDIGAGGVLPTFACWAGAWECDGEAAADGTLGSTGSALCRPDLDHPIVIDRGGVAGTYAYDSAMTINPIRAGTRVRPAFEFISTTHSGSGCGITVNLSMRLIGYPSADLINGYFLDGVWAWD